MKKYILAEKNYRHTGNEEDFHAGSKAVRDVHEIAVKKKYEPLYIIKYSEQKDIFSKVLNQLFSLKSWLSILFLFKKGDILLMQCPIRRKQLGRKFVQNRLNKKGHVISLIHDVEELRCFFNQPKFDHDEFETTLKNSEIFIVHNERMKSYFREKGIDETRLISLQIFDYLTNKEILSEKTGDGIVLAGNLDIKKSPYVYKLNEVNAAFTLYGPNYVQKDSPNIRYNGPISADKLPGVLRGKYGLVWDGDSITSCTGKAGEYTRYNNPHKVSLYIVSKLPVIMWKEAALAEFIVKNHLGIAVDSLLELPRYLDQVTEEEYDEMKNNLEVYSDRLQSGYFTGTALDAAEEKCCHSYEKVPVDHF